MMCVVSTFRFHYTTFSGALMTNFLSSLLLNNVGALICIMMYTCSIWLHLVHVWQFMLLVLH